MADTLPSPPESRPQSPAHDEPDTRDELVQTLDSLLEQYLELLDQYTTLREDLSRTFSAGFLSLAQTQRTSNLGAGRRYGKDGYDGRMKAQRRFKISSSDQESHVPETHWLNGSGNHNRVSYNSYRSQQDQEEKKTIHPESEASVSEDADHAPRTTSLQTAKKDASCRDPLTWYGILVPPSLRHSQTDFVKCVHEIIPQLLNVELLMRTAEHDIRRLREETRSGSRCAGPSVLAPLESDNRP